MNSGFLICASLSEAQQAAQACQQWMLANVARYNADCWDIPQQRKDGNFRFYVDIRVSSALTKNQRSAVKDFAVDKEEEVRLVPGDISETIHP